MFFQENWHFRKRLTSYRLFYTNYSNAPSEVLLIKKEFYLKSSLNIKIPLRVFQNMEHACLQVNTSFIYTWYMCYIAFTGLNYCINIYLNKMWSFFLLFLKCSMGVNISLYLDIITKISIYRAIKIIVNVTIITSM